MLGPATNRRERILVFGPSGAGKSSTWISVADWAGRTKAPVKIRVIDTDHAYEAMADDSFTNVEVYDAETSEFPKWGEQLRAWRPSMGRDDWLVVDMIDQAWTGAQEYYWWTVTGGDPLGEIFLKAETEDFDTVGDYGKHWGNINRLYNDFMRAILQVPCNVLCVAPAAEVALNAKTGLALNKDQQEYVKFRYRPIGQKRLAHAFHTILLAREIPSEKGSQWNLTTVKERGPIGKEKRRDMKGDAVEATTGFVGAYLVKVAGWHM